MKPKVLVIAEAANPEWVSVPLVGWHIATSLREVADVHIVTQIRNRFAFLRQGLQEGIDFTAIDSEAIAAPFYRIAEHLRGGAGKGWTTLTAIQSATYPYFEHLVWTKFGDAIKSGTFDIVHRVTPLTPTAPSSLAKRCKRAGIPFVLGPLNGGLPWPQGFSQERSKEKEWLSLVRGAYAFLPFLRSTYSNASAVLAGSRHTASELQRYGAPIIYVPENGIDASKFSSGPVRQRSGQMLKAVFIGRLVPYKGADIAIRACADLMAAGKLNLDIIGDGPEMAALQNLSNELNLGGSVKFRGWLPHVEVGKALLDSDLLVFPSIREFGGGVVLEAMACGVIPVIVDYGGPGEIVTQECGLKIPLSTKEEMTKQISNVLSDLVEDSARLHCLASNGKKRADKLYMWNKKAEQIASVYHWINSGARLDDFQQFPFAEHG